MKHTSTTPVTLRNPPTVVDVAIAANVAIGTVSRVLNTPELVGPDIRQRVIEAIERLEYRPLRRRRRKIDPNRRRRAKRGNIGVIFFGMDESLTQLPVFAEALRGIEKASIAGQENLMRASIPQADRIPLFLARGLVDGLIVRSPMVGDWRERTSPELVAAIERLPHVWLIAQPGGGAGGDVIENDKEVSGDLAVKCLHRHGHRRIALFRPYPGPTQVNEVGYACMMHAENLGMEVRTFKRPDAGEVRWPWGTVTSAEALLPLVDEWAAIPAAQRPTAIVVGADGVGVHLYSALTTRGFKVGRDVSVFSMRREGNLAATLTPKLTSIDIRAEEIGRRAVDQLRWRFEHPNDRLPVCIRIRPSLVEGDSVATVG